MSFQASFQPYHLQFKIPSGTSRGVLREKLTYLLKLENQGQIGIGECALFKGLSADDRQDYENKLQWFCDNFNGDLDLWYEELREFPSIQIGLEQAFLNINQTDKKVFFDTPFTAGKRGIPINGLIWMGTLDFMKTQFQSKIKEGYRCIKFKIGEDWPNEKAMLREIRKEFPASQLEIRVDANGAFDETNIRSVLQELGDLDIHSIEQPIAKGQIQLMAQLCSETYIPIALDEELIGHFYTAEKKEILRKIQPQYIILKPSLIGGFKGSLEWINCAKELGIKWWITSALESNIGLNAIAQFTDTLHTQMPQGLGTGGLFRNNFESPLYIQNAKLWCQNNS